MIKAVIVSVFGFFLALSPVYAISPPALSNPANNSTISSIPTFSWQAVSGSGGYNILIDDEPTVTSPYAKTPYYPTNPSYSPKTLNPGTYYWKVKTKDSNGNWSSFSTIWSFVLTTSTPSPTPTPTQTSNPTPSPTPTSSSTSQPTSSFTISNTPSQINSDQSFSVSVNLSLPSNPNTNFYLKGAFKKADSSNYFGFTKVSESWVKNGSSYSDQYLITTDSSGNWSGNLEIRPDPNDSGFTGSNDYLFKVGRYTSSGSSPTWSNESTITITSTESGNQDSTSTSTSDNPSSTTNPSPLPSSVKTTTTTSIQPKNYDKLIYRIASVAAATTSATPSAIEIQNQRQTNPFIWIGLVFIFAGGGLLGYIYIKKNAKIHIPWRR